MVADRKLEQSLFPALPAVPEVAHEILARMRAKDQVVSFEDVMGSYRDWMLRQALLRWELERES